MSEQWTWLEKRTCTGGKEKEPDSKSPLLEIEDTLEPLSFCWNNRKVNISARKGHWADSISSNGRMFFTLTNLVFWKTEAKRGFTHFLYTYLVHAFNFCALLSSWSACIHTLHWLFYSMSFPVCLSHSFLTLFVHFSGPFADFPCTLFSVYHLILEEYIYQTQGRPRWGRAVLAFKWMLVDPWCWCVLYCVCWQFCLTDDQLDRLDELVSTHSDQKIVGEGEGERGEGGREEREGERERKKERERAIEREL